MSEFFKRWKWFAACAAVGATLTGCGGVTYKLPDEYWSDGDLLTAAMKEAAVKFAANPKITADAGPFVLKSLAGENGESKMLYDRFGDLLAAAFADRGVSVAPAETEDAATVEYRLIECRIMNVKVSGGNVKRVARAVVHGRIYGAEAGELFWAGEYEGEAENVVPKRVVSKLTDERIKQIGPQNPEGGKNPFVEPLLVTGITGALIYLFAVSAAQ